MMATRVFTMTAVFMSVALIGARPNELAASGPATRENGEVSLRGPAYRDVVVPAGTTLPLVLDSDVASDQSHVEDSVGAHVTARCPHRQSRGDSGGQLPDGVCDQRPTIGPRQGTRSSRVPVHSAGDAHGGTAAHQHQRGCATGARDEAEGCDHHRVAGRRQREGRDHRRHYRR